MEILLVEVPEVWQFFCSILVEIEAEGRANLVIDNSDPTVNPANATGNPSTWDLIITKRKD